MKTIGVGGFGKIKLYKDIKYNNKYGIVCKFINLTPSKSATNASCTLNRNICKQEAELMGIFKECDNCAELLGHQGHRLAMKYYELGSLDKLIISGLANKDRYKIASNIIKGLTFIHNKGYVHSDLKCSNILCEQEYINGIPYIKAVISDFGATRKKGRSCVAYTEGYNAPEMLKEGISFQTDIYALGKTLIELFAKIPQKNIKLINYNNYPLYVFKHHFLNDYVISSSFQINEKQYPIINNFYRLVRNCLYTDPNKRPSLLILQLFVDVLKGESHKKKMNSFYNYK